MAIKTAQRYEPKNNLTPEEVSECMATINTIEQAMSEKGIAFSEKKELIRLGIDKLFSIMSEIKEYTPQEPDLTKKFESPGTEFDIETFDNIESFSSQNIDRVIQDTGYGTTTSAGREIYEKLVNNPQSISNMGLNISDIQRLVDSTMKGEHTLTPEKLTFMKKTKFINNMLMRPELAKQLGRLVLDNPNGEKEILSCYDAAKSSINSQDYESIVIGSRTVGEIAREQIEKKVAESLIRVNEGKLPIIRNPNPSVSIVCGLPGSGKSSVFVDDLTNRGYMTVDLDEIAIDICRTFGVEMTDAVIKSVYGLAGAISSSIITQSMARGYDICVEKIGQSSRLIDGIVKNLESLEAKTSIETGTNIKYRKSLLMTACGSIDSAENNSIRNAEQIFRGEFLRTYDYTDLIFNNNCTTYSYIDLLGKPELISKFDNVTIKSRKISFDGISLYKGTSLAKIQQSIASGENLTNKDGKDGNNNEGM